MSYEEIGMDGWMDGWMDGLFLSVMFSSCVIQILHLLHFPTPIQTTNPIQFNSINSSSDNLIHQYVTIL